MLSTVVDIAALAKRRFHTRMIKPDNPNGDQPGNLDLPPWAFGVLLLDFVLFLPAFLIIGYTLSSLFLTLAMVEDPSPPAYQPLGVEDTDNAVAGAGADSAADPAKPFTSSLRATSRLLRSVGGWKAYFRGLACAVVLSFLSGLVEIFFGFFTFPWIGGLLASLALVQFSAAWVTIVVSQPSPKPFYHRLPAFRKTFEATCFPILLNWLAVALAAGVPVLLFRVTGVARWDPQHPNQVPAYHARDIWKGLALTPVSLALVVLLVIPSEVVLRRVQASLLQPDEDPIVPFDRSFAGTVEPAIVGGKGYVTLQNAFKTFSRASWIRLYTLYAKIFAITLALYAVFGGILVAEFFAVAANSSVKHGN